MLVALISDVHANLAALETVLAHAEKAGATAVWSMGDQVGYGPQPNEVLSRLQEAGAECLLGNHDAVPLGEIDLETFNPWAAEAARWTNQALSEASRAYVAALPRTRIDAETARVHGSLRDPIWEYVLTAEAARAHFALQQTPLSIVGHTHLPMVLRSTSSGQFDVLEAEPGQPLGLDDGAQYCLNPGSVGQPRDGDPRAGYAVLDTSEREVVFHRLAYDVAETQRHMMRVRLPEFLIRRLERGR